MNSLPPLNIDWFDPQLFRNWTFLQLKITRRSVEIKLKLFKFDFISSNDNLTIVELMPLIMLGFCYSSNIVEFVEGQIHGF